MLPAYPRIPYGEADFRRIRLNRWLYVDKTRFLRLLEQERYVFLIRPRRFGKSLWASVLENYYDRFWADGFDATFAGTDIGRVAVRGPEPLPHPPLRRRRPRINAFDTLERKCRDLLPDRAANERCCLGIPTCVSIEAPKRERIRVAPRALAARC